MNKYLQFFIVLCLLCMNLNTWAKPIPPEEKNTKPNKASACWQQILDANANAPKTAPNPNHYGENDGKSTFGGESKTSQPNSLSYQDTWDKETLQKRAWDEAKLKKYNGEKDFSYKPEEAPKLAPKQTQAQPVAQESNSNIWNTLIISLVALIIGAIVWSVFRGQMSQILSAAQPVAGHQVNLIEDDIKKNDFKTLITNSVQEKDYRKGVRMLYLEALKILTVNNWIIWKQHKTNHDYLSELSISPFKKSFEELTRHFEYVWYGQVPMNEELFASTQAVFNDFKSQVKPK
ncbi:MAG: DUF4129 domain-containing protein [Bacteroidia bacterium]